MFMAVRNGEGKGVYEYTTGGEKTRLLSRFSGSSSRAFPENACGEACNWAGVQAKVSPAVNRWAVSRDSTPRPLSPEDTAHAAEPAGIPQAEPAVPEKQETAAAQTDGSLPQEDPVPQETCQAEPGPDGTADTASLSGGQEDAAGGTAAEDSAENSGKQPEEPAAGDAEAPGHNPALSGADASEEPVSGGADSAVPGENTVPVPPAVSGQTQSAVHAEKESAEKAEAVREPAPHAQTVRRLPGNAQAETAPAETPYRHGTPRPADGAGKQKPAETGRHFGNTRRTAPVRPFKERPVSDVEISAEHRENTPAVSEHGQNTHPGTVRQPHSKKYNPLTGKSQYQQNAGHGAEHRTVQEPAHRVPAQTHPVRQPAEVSAPAVSCGNTPQRTSRTENGTHTAQTSVLSSEVRSVSPAQTPVSVPGTVPVKKDAESQTQKHIPSGFEKILSVYSECGQYAVKITLCGGETFCVSLSEHTENGIVFQKTRWLAFGALIWFADASFPEGLPEHSDWQCRTDITVSSESIRTVLPVFPPAASGHAGFSPEKKVSDFSRILDIYRKGGPCMLSVTMKDGREYCLIPDTYRYIAEDARKYIVPENGRIPAAELSCGGLAARIADECPVFRETKTGPKNPVFGEIVSPEIFGSFPASEWQEEDGLLWIGNAGFPSEKTEETESGAGRIVLVPCTDPAFLSVTVCLSDILTVRRVSDRLTVEGHEFSVYLRKVMRLERTAAQPESPGSQN